MPPKPWFRLYNDVVDDPKVQRLSADLFRSWINILCLASRNDGVLPNVTDLAFGLRIAQADVMTLLDRLTEAELMERTPAGWAPHNWRGRQFASDSSTPRVQQHRHMKQASETVDGNVTGNVSETADETDHGTSPFPPTPPLSPTETETETEAEAERDSAHAGVREAPPVDAPPAAPSKPVKATKYPATFEAFWAAYPKGDGFIKADAYAQFKALKPDGDLVDAMLAGIERWRHGRRWQQGMVMAPARWLKGRAWEAEIEPWEPPPDADARASPNGRAARGTPAADFHATIDRFTNDLKEFNRGRSNVQQGHGPALPSPLPRGPT